METGKSPPKPSLPRFDPSKFLRTNRRKRSNSNASPHPIPSETNRKVTATEAVTTTATTAPKAPLSAPATNAMKPESKENYPPQPPTMSHPQMSTAMVVSRARNGSMQWVPATTTHNTAVHYAYNQPHSAPIAPHPQTNVSHATPLSIYSPQPRNVDVGQLRHHDPRALSERYMYGVARGVTSARMQESAQAYKNLLHTSHSTPQSTSNIIVDSANAVNNGNTTETNVEIVDSSVKSHKMSDNRPQGVSETEMQMHAIVSDAFNETKDIINVSTQSIERILRRQCSFVTAQLYSRNVLCSQKISEHVTKSIHKQLTDLQQKFQILLKVESEKYIKTIARLNRSIDEYKLKNNANCQSLASAQNASPQTKAEMQKLRDSCATYCDRVQIAEAKIESLENDLSDKNRKIERLESQLSEYDSKKTILEQFGTMWQQFSGNQHCANPLQNAASPQQLQMQQSLAEQIETEQKICKLTAECGITDEFATVTMSKTPPMLEVDSESSLDMNGDTNRGGRRHRKRKQTDTDVITDDATVNRESSPNHHSKKRRTNG